MNSWEEEFKEKFLTNKSYYQSKNGIVYWSELLEHIHSLLKRQREICDSIAKEKIPLWCGICNAELHISLDLTNAPEPEGGK